MNPWQKIIATAVILAGTCGLLLLLNSFGILTGGGAGLLIFLTFLLIGNQVL